MLRQLTHRQTTRGGNSRVGATITAPHFDSTVTIVPRAARFWSRFIVVTIALAIAGYFLFHLWLHHQAQKVLPNPWPRLLPKFHIPQRGRRRWRRASGIQSLADEPASERVGGERGGISRTVVWAALCAS